VVDLARTDQPAEKETLVKLFHHPMSSSARRVLVTVSHLGIELEHRLIDLGKPGDREALAEVNPNRKIPVLVDGDFVLWESHAIMQYLAERTFGQTLYPGGMRERADVQRWLYWSSAHLAPAIGPINYERMWKKFVEGPNAAPDQALIDRHENAFHQTIAVLEGHLVNRSQICGRDLTLADISVASTLMYMEATKLPVEGYPNVLALVRRVRALEAWQATEPARFS
jgi:glutathione S-transferase